MIRFLDLSVTDPAERADLLGALEAALDHGRLVLGPEVEAFERRIAEFCGRTFGIGVGTGTDALILGIKALGIGPGDEVITTPLSWLATGSAILLNGATPVFADTDESLNIDPTTIEPLINSRTKAILPVHFAGHLARMPEIMEIARRHRLMIVEDCAQAFGATYQDRPAGSFGDIACLSFNAMKVLGALGDAGMVLTDDANVAARLKMLRHSGVAEREYCDVLSHNCRLDTVQAAMLLKRLDRHPAVVARRRAIACRYDRELAGYVEIPPRLPGYESIFYTYQIRTTDRDGLKKYMEDLGIETRIQHPVVMNDQPAFRGRTRGKSPRAAELVNQILCLPVHEKLSDAEQDLVVEAVRHFIRNQR